MEAKNKWGWWKEIESSKGCTLDDENRCWVGENRWAECYEWPDLYRATIIYYKMHRDNSEYHYENKELFDNRFKLLDEICLSRDWQNSS